jgi:hypothetical protein
MLLRKLNPPNWTDEFRMAVVRSMDVTLNPLNRLLRASPSVTRTFAYSAVWTVKIPFSKVRGVSRPFTKTETLGWYPLPVTIKVLSTGWTEEMLSVVTGTGASTNGIALLGFQKAWDSTVPYAQSAE